MQRKLVITAVGAFAYGALVSWAVTADYLEKKAKEDRQGLRDALYEQSRKHAEMVYLSHQPGVQAAIEEFKNPQAEVTPVDDHPELPFDEEGSAHYDEVTTNDTHVIENGEIREISLDKEPNAFGESISVVEQDMQEAGLESATVEVGGETYEVPEGETVEETRSNLQKIIDSYTPDPEDQQAFQSAVRTATDPDYTPPFVISQAKYAWDEEEGDEYSKITLTYYPKDRVLLDDQDEPEDVLNTVGWRALGQFGFETDDPDVVFVRNRRLLTDFEVIRDEENELPLHVKYGMAQEEFNTRKAAGLIRLREEDRG